MKLVSTPYRWLWRTAWQNVSHWAWDIRNGVRNLVTFFEAVWWFRSWDWTGMVRLLETSAREMRKCQEGGIHTGADKEARRLLILETTCKRMLADEYADKAGYLGDARWLELSEYEQRRVFKHASYMEDQDARYLGKMLRFIRCWWD